MHVGATGVVERPRIPDLARCRAASKPLIDPFIQRMVIATEVLTTTKTIDPAGAHVQHDLAVFVISTNRVGWTGPPYEPPPLTALRP